MFWSKPSGGPDAVGGLSPVDFPEVKCRNRSGGTHIKGEVVQLAFTPGAATEIATNDSNSYKPGYSNDTIWNTVIDPRSNATNGSSRQRGGLFGVCMEPFGVADNAIGYYKFFGLIEDAFVVKASADHTIAGDQLSVTSTNSFSGTVTSNLAVAAMYADIQTNLTNRKLRRVLLHNGFLALPRGGDIS
jgi:hypothetical protein